MFIVSFGTNSKKPKKVRIFEKPAPVPLICARHIY
jgi:hypothetical protein